jgi:hypothetical protein
VSSSQEPKLEPLDLTLQIKSNCNIVSLLTLNFLLLGYLSVGLHENFHIFKPYNLSFDIFFQIQEPLGFF